MCSCSSIGPFDICIGADVFYDSSSKDFISFCPETFLDFQDLLASISFIDCPALIAYQERGEGIEELLELLPAWDMQHKIVEFSEEASPGEAIHKIILFELIPNKKCESCADADSSLALAVNAAVTVSAEP